MRVIGTQVAPVATTATYPPIGATTQTGAIIGPSGTGRLLFFSVVGNALMTLFGQGDGGVARRTPEFPAPSAGSYAAQGAMWRSTDPAFPATVQAVLYEAGDPMPLNPSTTQESPLSVRSAIYPADFLALLNFDRSLIVAQDFPYSIMQVGRLLLHDDLEGTLGWAQIAGTVAKSATRSLSGANSLLLTTGAVAGNQAIARKFFPLPADQFFTTQTKLAVSLWFQPQDANWRDLILRIRPDDSFHKWEAGWRYHQRQGGVIQNAIEFENSGQIFVAAPTGGSAYKIADGSASVGDSWHYMLIVLNYLQTQAASSPTPNGYLTYHLGKFDDFTTDPTLFPLTPAAAIAGAANRTMDVSLELTTDVNAAASVAIDEILVSDISAVSEML